MDNMGWIAVEAAFTSINVIFTYLFMQAFLKKKSKKHVGWQIVVLLSILIIKLSVNIFFNDNIVLISSTTVLSALAVGWLCFDAKLREIWIASAFLFIAGASSEFVAAFIVTALHGISIDEVMYFNAYRLQGRTLNYLIYLVIIALVNRFRNVSTNAVDDKLMLALCLLPIASIMIFLVLGIRIFRMTDVMTSDEVVPLISIVVVNMLVFVMVEILMRQAEKSRTLVNIESQNDAQQAHIRQLVDAHTQIRTVSHDFKQQADVLYGLCKKGWYGELESILSEISGHNFTSYLVETDNIMLDSILSAKKAEAIKQGIDFSLNLDVYPSLRYIDIDLCILLGNGLDNAIDACMRAVYKKRVIEMDLRATATQFTCRIKNTIGEMPKLRGNLFATLKGDAIRHGIGLQSMKQICDAMGGDMTCEYDEDCFILWINLDIET